MQAQESFFPSMNVVTSISEVIMEYLNIQYVSRNVNSSKCP
jgi:hypothetical protein